jgi:hypothetical protein
VPPVLSRTHFGVWAERYLDSDPDSRTRNPPGVKIIATSGQWFDIVACSLMRTTLCCPAESHRLEIDGRIEK